MDDEQLRRELDLAAGQIDAGDTTTALAGVSSVMHGRRRRRRAFAAVGVTAVLAAGGATVLSLRGTDGDDVLRSAPGSTAADASVTTVDAGPGEPTTIGPEPASGVPVQVVDVQPSVVPAPGPDGGTSFVEWLVPWADGFLTVATVTTAQPLPEIPDDVTALFSIEVQELFADGLPPTIGEATAMLSEAGLLDEVTAVLADNPEVNELIFSEPVATPVVSVWFSLDGEEWDPVEVILPDGMSSLQEVTVAGDRLVAVDTRQGPEATTIVVASTTDLATWESQTVEIRRPADLPAEVDFRAWPATIAAGESGWVLEVHRFTNVPPETVLPADVRELIDGETYGGGFSTDENGIEVQIDTSADGDTQTYSYTWEELDIDPALVPYLNAPAETELWTAPFGGSPANAGGVGSQGGGIVALPDRFVRTVPTLEISPDGVEWTAVDVPWERSYIASVLAVDGGVVVFTQDNAGDSRIYRSDPSFGNWTPIDIPGAPDWMSPVFGLGGSSPVLIVDTFRPETTSQDVVVEYDGFVFTTGNGVTTLWYDLVDVATGDVVASESVDLATLQDGFDEDGPYEHLTLHTDGSGLTIDDPESGAVLLSIPQDVLDRAYEEAYGGDTAEEYQPALWLLAAVGPDRWLVDELDDGLESSGPSRAAINGDIVLVAAPDGWLRYDVGS